MSYLVQEYGATGCVVLPALPATRPAAPLFRFAGSKYVQTKWDAKDKKKHEEGKLVKSRNEPCCIVQVRRAALRSGTSCTATLRNDPCCAIQPRCAALNRMLLCAGV